MRGKNITVEKGNYLYGVDLTKEITPIIVRDAIIQCFYEAHNDVLDLARENFGNPSMKRFEEMKKTHVKELIQDIFLKINGDFNNPTKNQLFRVIDNLRKFASTYRKPEIIREHFTEILLMIEKI